MTRFFFSLLFLVLALFALPVLLHAFIAIIPALLGLVVLIAVGSILFGRRRRW